MWRLQQKNVGVVKWQTTCCYEGMSVNKQNLKCDEQINMVGKHLFEDLRLLIVGNIIRNGGDPETGVFPGKFVQCGL